MPLLFYSHGHGADPNGELVRYDSSYYNLLCVGGTCVAYNV